MRHERLPEESQWSIDVIRLNSKSLSLLCKMYLNLEKNLVATEIVLSLYFQPIMLCYVKALSHVLYSVVNYTFACQTVTSIQLESYLVPQWQEFETR